MKCAICNQKIEETFLRKIIGTHVKDSKGKRRSVCNKCQSSHSLDEIRKSF